jgi:hypothetical protein
MFHASGCGYIIKSTIELQFLIISKQKSLIRKIARRCWENGGWFHGKLAESGPAAFWAVPVGNTIGECGLKGIRGSPWMVWRTRARLSDGSLTELQSENWIQMYCRDSQPENGDSPIRFNSDPNSKVTSSMEQHWVKQKLPIDSTERGMKIDFSDLQSLKARSSIRLKCESDSNETLRHSPDRSSTEAGMHIDLRAEQSSNAFAPIRSNWDPGWNVTSQSDPRLSR